MHGRAGSGASDQARAARAAVEKYRGGAMTRWHPKRCLALGVGFRGKEMALTHENQPSAMD